MGKAKLFSVKNLTRISILGAISFVLSIFAQPLFTPYLKLEISDVPVIFGAIYLSPFSYIFIELIKNVLGIFLKNSGTVGIGEFANFIVGIALVFPFSFIKKRENGNFIIAGIVGIILMLITSIFANIYVFIPLYKLFVSSDTGPIIKYIFSITIPFNLVKGATVVAISFVLFVLLKKYFSRIFNEE